MPTPRKVPDDLWAEIETLIPPPPPPRYRGGRNRADDRKLLDGMLHRICEKEAPFFRSGEEFSRRRQAATSRYRHTTLYAPCDTICL